MTKPSLYWAPWAWLPQGWCPQVLMAVDAQGRWADIHTHTAAPPDAMRLDVPVLPGLVNAHSHAFQRAFAGLAERRDSAEDDFWSWRDRMYRVAGAITPDELRTIATQLYGELLQSGYTQVCEFHYVQHQPDGRPYGEAQGGPLAMGQALIDAAAEVGMGLTLLPVLYERAGFAQPALRPDQARFHLDADAVWARCEAVNRQGHATLNAGVAIHSLRAARAESVQRLRALTEGWQGPIHIHVAEQQAEVRDCLAHTGLRPVQWLAAHAGLDPRWHLVHATHVTAQEIAAVGQAGAQVVICPSTEANLGDGLTDMAGWLGSGAGLSIGSDSHVTRCWREELRWLEYGQRLQHQQRNVLAAPPTQGATAERLWRAALSAGAHAAGLAQWGLVPGARADLLVPDPSDPALAGIPPQRLLDACVFSSPTRPFSRVMVAGRWVVQNGQAKPGGQAYRELMQRLWG